VSTNIGYPSAMMTTSTSIDRCDRFPADVIEQAVWLCIRCPLSLRMVEDVLAERGIVVSHDAVRCRAETFGRIDASKIPRRAPQFGDKWHLDEVVISINGKKQCHVRAVDADGLWRPGSRRPGSGPRGPARSAVARAQADPARRA
jgi:putative transposase